MSLLHSDTVNSLMKQISFAEAEYNGKKKITRRERFLNDLDRLVPWDELIAVIDPLYPAGGGRGRPPIGIARMLRMYVAQQALGLSDEGIEDATYDSQSVRTFVGIDLAIESAPDATTLLKFRRLMEQHGLTKKLFKAINQHLADKGLMLRNGTIVDASLIAAAPSTKNKAKQRDPAMRQSKKGKQYFFGMKAHIGVDVESGLVHSVVGTSGNISDISQTTELLHGDEQVVFADAGYTGIEKREEAKDLDVDWQIAAKRGKIKRLSEQSAYRKALESLEHAKASVRSKVEHPFHVIKNIFRHRKVRYRGLEKNTAQLFSLFGLGNLMLAKKYLLPEYGIAAS